MYLEVLAKLQIAGYRASEKKTELFKREITWLGYYLNQNKAKPIKDKFEAITKSEAPKKGKGWKLFLGSTQYLSKFINYLSKETDRMTKLLKKDVNWELTRDVNKDFGKLKRTSRKNRVWLISTRRQITAQQQAPVTRGWEQRCGRRKETFSDQQHLLAGCLQILKKAMNELELLGALWRLVFFRYYAYRKKVLLLTEHQAFQPLLTVRAI